jgi:prepilin-type N-terminal cleavage/methylation domain-containing protein
MGLGDSTKMRLRFLVHHGFSLIEVMIAVMIMTLGIFPVYYLFSAGTRGVTVSLREILAVNHAVSTVELLKGLKAETLQNFCDSGEFLATQSGWVVYDRRTDQLSVTEDEKGVWETSGTEVGERFFREELKPGDKIGAGVLPPMEVYFTQRKVEIRCEEGGCAVGVRVSWKPEQGEDPDEKSVLFRTLVAGTK